MKYFEFGKMFPDVGHGGLVGEHIPRFADEVRSAHAQAAYFLDSS